jgi:hypothetical protein
MHPGYPPPHRYAAYRPRPSNGLGVAGFTLSLVGLLATCGVLCPLGLLLSLFSLFRRPRGLAIAGTVIGLIGSIWVVGVLLLLTTARMTRAERAEHVRCVDVTQAAFAQGNQLIEIHRAEQGRLPDGVAGNKLLLELTDGWGGSIRYDLEDGDKTYLLRSAGPDGEFDTADDLTDKDSRTHQRGKNLSTASRNSPGLLTRAACVRNARAPGTPAA